MKSVVINDVTLDIIQPLNVAHRDQAILLFSDVPGRFTRNEDLAVHLASRYQIPSYIIHYKGIGRQAGEFSFVQSINDATGTLSKMAETLSIKSFHLIGHGWGALMALNAGAQRPELIGSLTLLSPILILPSRNQLAQMIDDFIKTQSALAHAAIPANLTAEVGEIDIHHSPIVVAKKLKAQRIKIQIFHGRKDEAIPVESSVYFCQTHSSIAQVHILDADHNFSTRREIFKCMEAVFDQRLKPTGTPFTGLDQKFD